jgi:hypothetical protein
MDKFELKKISDKKYLLTMIQDNEGTIVSNGLSFDKSELRKLYIELRELFSNK